MRAQPQLTFFGVDWAASMIALKNSSSVGMPVPFTASPTSTLGNWNISSVPTAVPVSIARSSLDAGSQIEEEDEGVDSWERGTPNTASSQAEISTLNKFSKSEFVQSSPTVNEEWRSNWLAKLSRSPEEVSREKIASKGSGADTEKVPSWAVVASSLISDRVDH